MERVDGGAVLAADTRLTEAMPFYFLAHSLLGMLIASNAPDAGHNTFANLKYNDLLEASRTLVSCLRVFCFGGTRLLFQGLTICARPELVMASL